MANLEKALEKVLGWEGGWANDPDDTGGPTMRGVTLATYKEYRRRLGKPAPTQADLKKITYNEIVDLANVLYWSKIMGDKIQNQSIAELCFDCIWGSGTGYIKKIQEVLGVTADGVFGPQTLNKMNSWIPQRELFNKLWNRRKLFLEGCSTAWKYLKGWMRRLNSYTFEETPILIDESPIDQLEESSDTNLESSTIEDIHENSSEDIQESSTTEIHESSTEEIHDNRKNLFEWIIKFIKKIFKIK